MPPPALIQNAIEVLCQRFERGEYSPTPVIDIGALIAYADGRVDPDEIDALKHLLQPCLGAQLDGELVGYLIDSAIRVVRAAGIDARVRLIAEILLDCDAVEEGVLVALGVAFASDGLGAEERVLVGKLARAARMSDAHLAELIARVEALPRAAAS